MYDYGSVLINNSIVDVALVLQHQHYGYKTTKTDLQSANLQFVQGNINDNVKFP